MSHLPRKMTTMCSESKITYTESLTAPEDFAFSMMKHWILILSIIVLHYGCIHITSASQEETMNSNSESLIKADKNRFYFPPPGQGMDKQDQRHPKEVGIKTEVIQRISQFVNDNPDERRGGSRRWALWRHGYLVHVEGDFNQTVDVASLRKTWHAMTVGAAIKQGKIPSYNQKISVWQTELKGNKAEATWRHVIMQAAGFDYPHGHHPDYQPGEMWTYSDWNPVHLCHALARVYGKKDFYDNYDDVIKQAYFDAIGMEGWSTRIVFDGSSQMKDGIRFVISLEHKGRLGLLALARGTWNGVELIPGWFVEELETKQTYGMKVNYEGPYDGMVGLRLYGDRFSECPYGYMTWVNTDGDYFPGADRAWAWAKGAGGTIILWNRKNGIIFAAAGINVDPGSNSIPHIIESCITGSNPLFTGTDVPSVGKWERFETPIQNTKEYADPYSDVTLEVTYKKPDGTTVDFWGFYDGGTTWRICFMPDQVGTWEYSAAFSDGAPGISGAFNCVESDAPGMLSEDELNPLWFGFKGGNHCLMRSFLVGDQFFASNCPDSRRREFLNWAQAQRLNVLSIASHYLNRNTPGRGKGWDTPALWPLNASEFGKLERILDDLADRHIMVFPFAGFFGRASNLPTKHGDQERYIRYVLARLGSYWNILFNVAGPEPVLKPGDYQNAMTATDINRLGNLIKSLDVFGHPISVHNRTGDDMFKDENWPSYGTLQGPKATDPAELCAGLLRNHHTSRPLYAQETLWSGNKNHPDYADTQLRKNAFVIMMSASALNFADNGGPEPGDMGDSSSGFSGSLELPDRRQARHDIIRKVWDFFKTMSFYLMRPRQDLVSSSYCLAEEGAQYLVYLDSGGSVDVAISDGTYSVQWINAQDTDDRKEGSATTDGKSLAAPDYGDDWLLYLTRL